MPPRNTDEQRELGGNCAIFNNCNLEMWNILGVEGNFERELEQNL